MAESASSPEPAPVFTSRVPFDGTVVGRMLGRVHIDFVPADPQPSWFRWVLATVVAIVGALGVDAALVAIGKAVFPSTKNFVHFQFADYSKLTVIGVVVAGVGWPLVTRISSRPRAVFLRAAFVVTLVLLVPDLYIWHIGEPTRGVIVLMTMHIAIAVVTYNALVRIAPAGEGLAITDGVHLRA